MGEVFQSSVCEIIEVSRVENIAIHLALVAFGCTGNGKDERCFYLPLRISCASFWAASPVVFFFISFSATQTMDIPYSHPYKRERGGVLPYQVRSQEPSIHTSIQWDVYQSLWGFPYGDGRNP